jgi:hypothetical protein
VIVSAAVVCENRVLRDGRGTREGIEGGVYSSVVFVMMMAKSAAVGHLHQGRTDRIK